MLSRNRIKYIQSLSRKKFRDIHQCFIAETPKVVNEFLNSSYKTEIVLGLGTWLAENLAHLDRNTEIIAVSEDELNKVSQLKNAHSVLSVIRMPQFKTLPDFSKAITIALDDLQDPGNLGTIIRISDWFGISNIITSMNTADVFSPKVVQASMGSLAHVNVFRLPLEDFLKETKIPVYAAALDGVSIYAMPAIQSGILVIGNEGKGISQTILSLAAEKISIPRFGKAESLNAAVATGIILSHLIRENSSDSSNPEK